MTKAGITEINGVKVTVDHPVVKALVEAHTDFTKPVPDLARKVLQDANIADQAAVKDALKRLYEADYRQVIIDGQMRRAGKTLEEATRIADAQLALHQESQQLFRGLSGKTGNTQEEIIQYLKEGSARLNTKYNPQGVNHLLSEVKGITDDGYRVFIGGQIYGKSPLIAIAGDGSMWVGDVATNLSKVEGGGFKLVGKLKRIE